MRRKKKPRIALLIETSGGYGRSVLLGVARYARLQGPWSLYCIPCGHDQTLPNMRKWQGTGIIARIESRAMAEVCAAAHVPVVALDLSPEHHGYLMRRRVRVTEMHPDPWAIARLAFEHLAERGLSRFAFVGVKGEVWSEQRRDAFVAEVKRAGHPECQVHDLNPSSRSTQYAQEQARLAAWFNGQPKPLGLMCCNDDSGREVLNALLVANVRVPDEVAVVGVDNDEVLCELCDPPLSSVSLGAERGGYEASGLLDRMMSGRARKAQALLVEPVGVVARGSTEVVAVPDRKLAKALQFIRNHAHEPIRVRDVLREVPMARRAMEIRFRRTMHRSIHDEIIRARLEHAKRLLRETSTTLEDLATRCGFGTSSHLAAVFRLALGMTPGQYRRRTRME